MHSGKWAWSGGLAQRWEGSSRILDRPKKATQPPKGLVAMEILHLLADGEGLG